MSKRHVAFVVESAHGHINPTLGIASKLIERGYRVSYAVKDYFARRVLAIGAEAKVYRPLEIKLAFFEEIQTGVQGDGPYPFDFDRLDLGRVVQRQQVETEDTLSQLLKLYEGDRPDLIIYDRTNLAGRELGARLGTACIEHSPMMIQPSSGYSYNDNLVIVSLPEFFQTNRAELDSRFKFVGPVYTDGRIFSPWLSELPPRSTVLVSASTGLLPQKEYFQIVARAFADLPLHVVLSIGDEMDPVSLAPIPSNCEINQFSSHQEILAQSCLFVTHGGPAGIFEALRFGVPLLMIPPCQAHDIYVRRAVELGLGISVSKPDLNIQNLRSCAASILQDDSISNNVKRTQKLLVEMNGGEQAADLVDMYIKVQLSTSTTKPSYT